MSKSVSRLGSGAVRWQLMLAGAAAVILSGCSGSVDRFAENYSNPSDSDPVYTASIQAKPKYMPPSYKAPAYSQPQIAQNDDNIVQSPIASKPLVKPPQVDYTKQYQGTYSQQAGNQPAPAYPAPKYSYNAAPAPAYQKPAYKQPVIDDQQADNSAGDQVIASSKKKPVVVPFKTAEQSAADAQAVKAKPGLKPAVVARDDAAPAAGKTYTVANGDTLFSIGRKYNVSPFAIADANHLPKDKGLAVGKTIVIPGAGSQTAAANPGKIKPLAADDATGDENISSSDKGDGQDVAQSTAPQKIAPASAPAAASPSDALAMRWPVRGKIISPFGPKTGGMKNEGINISVPEGTNVQAAEAGVVAYAGNELKGYGNLVLIRHAGGYVTAYAHNSQILVKKGDTVKRGDLIAKSGSTGAVQSPQLHFEVRKGATALDPSTFLNSATASN